MIILALLMVLIPSWAFGHGGFKDGYGCHKNSKLGLYECHEGQFAGRTFPSKEAMLAELNPPEPDPDEAIIASLIEQIKAMEATIAMLEARLAVLNIPGPPRVSFSAGKFTWEAYSDSNAESFRLYCGSDSGAYTVIQTFKLPRTEILLQDTLLEQSKTYYCAVKAVSAGGEESLSFSNEVTFTVVAQGPGLYRCAFKWLGQVELAEDVCQRIMHDFCLAHSWAIPCGQRV